MNLSLFQVVSSSSPAKELSAFGSSSTSPLSVENQLLKSEVASLNQEMNHVLNRAKEAERGNYIFKSLINDCLTTVSNYDFRTR